MLSTWLRKITNTKQFYQGASIKPEDYRIIPFENNMRNLGKMF
jgi:hypothetical protein